MLVQSVSQCPQIAQLRHSVLLQPN
uniref:Uncharacterized protein n=1 Tax=Anguilla anguilla TaxID=7936 RepID=A0A0E9VDB5_ANGAN